jgi:hypothetical protein
MLAFIFVIPIRTIAVLYWAYFFKTQLLNVNYSHKVSPVELRQYKEFRGNFGIVVSLPKHSNITTVKGNQKISYQFL